mgnify:CR=1 FL=1
MDYIVFESEGKQSANLSVDQDNDGKLESTIQASDHLAGSESARAELEEGYYSVIARLKLDGGASENSRDLARAASVLLARACARPFQKTRQKAI